MTTEGLPRPDLHGAAEAISVAKSVIAAGIAAMAAGGGPDRVQVLAYDVAHAASAVRTAEAVLAYGANGEIEGLIACAFTADALADLAARTVGRTAEWGAAADWLGPAEAFVSRFRAPGFLASLAETEGPRHLDADFELVRDTFHRFAEEQIRPRAEHIHRANTDIPEEIISGMAEMGGFGMSVPEEYGGFATGGESDYMGMVVATEELAWGSLGAGGSLITRPEILTRAIVRGGTEQQKQYWLPAAGHRRGHGGRRGDRARLRLGRGRRGHQRDRHRGRLAGQRGEDLVYLRRPRRCPHAARPDRSGPGKGPPWPLPLPGGQAARRRPRFPPVPGTRHDGHPSGSSGRMEGRPIDTLGYRGMHSYEVAFENWFVPDANLVGGPEGLGRGFYLQMQGFENGRLQTAARAIGVMQAAYEAALEYASSRVVFGSRILDYQLTRTKLARMAVLIQATRQFSYEVARLMSKGEGTLEASMVKAYVCRGAEWVTREALQIHGGMGYAEEYAVSRYFVDARVLSIFEGADETLALKVIARHLVAAAGS